MEQAPASRAFRADVRAEGMKHRFRAESFMAMLASHPDSLQHLLEDATAVVHSDGHVLIRQDTLVTTAYVVNSGWAIATVLSPDGEEHVIRVYGPGDCFGFNLFGEPNELTVSVLGARTALLKISSETLFNNHLSRSMPLSAFLRAQDRYLRQADQHARTMAEPNGSLRLAQLLLRLAEQYGRALHHPSMGPEVLIPPLRQTELASWIGVSRETVARALRHWRLNGTIETGRRRIVLLDPAGLTDYRVFPDHPPAFTRQHSQ